MTAIRSEPRRRRLERNGHGHARLVSVDWSPGYREFAPPAALRPAVYCLWVSVVPAGGAPPRLVLPDACVDLIWQQGQGVCVAGPDTGPVPSSLAPGSVRTSYVQVATAVHEPASTEICLK